MKNNGLKVTAATVLLSASVLSTPLLGDAHGNDRDNRNDRGKSHRMMEKNHHKKESRDFNNVRWEKSDSRDNHVDVKSENRINKEKQATNIINENNNKSQPTNMKRVNNTEQYKYKEKQPEKAVNKPIVSTVTYAEADAYGKNQILPLIAGIETAKADLNWEELLTNYYSLDKALKGTSIFNKVEGDNNKETLFATYLAPAKEKMAELRLPLTIYAGIKHVEANIVNGETNRVTVKLHGLKTLMNKIDNVEGNALLEDLEAKLNALGEKVNNAPFQDYMKL